MQPIAEPHETLLVQQRQLIEGNRRAQMFPRGEGVLKLPKGMAVIKVKNGDVFHFNPKRLKASEIVKASNDGRENTLLDLGPVTKAEVVERAAKGEKPLAIVERTAEGIEARAAAGTDVTAAAQVAALEKAKSPGHVVTVEPAEHTITKRLQHRAEGGAVEVADGGPAIEELPDAPWAVADQAALPDAPWAASHEGPSPLAKAIEPITSYPATYNQINREAREQIGRGIEQLTEPAQRFDPVKDAEPPDSPAWRAAKGVGNTALGTVGYVASPLSAALRTVVGKPLEENTGIPKEYSEFAASLALPGVGLARVPGAAVAAPSKMQTVTEASERLGVPIPRAAATESIPIQATAGALKEVPVVGTPLVKASKESLSAMDKAVSDTVAGYGSGQPLLAGEKAIEGIERWVGGKSVDVARRMYDKVDALVDPAFERPLHATDRVVSEIMARRANAKISGSSPAVSEVLDGVQSSGMNYEGIKNLRTHIGDMTPEEMIAKGINKAEAKRIYNALSQDLRGTVLDAGGPDALKAFDRATSTYEAIAEKRKALSKIIGLKADATPERALARISEMANSKAGADFKGIVQVRRAIGPEKWDEITSAIVNKMGREKPGAEFSGDRFKTAWDAMPDNTKRIVFNSTDKPGLAKSVEDIMTLSGAHRSLMRYGNPSGTGRVATLGGMAGALWAAPIATIASAVGGNVLARVLASPVAAKNAAQWSVVYSNAAKNPSPARLALLSRTSENLANVINRDFGAKISGSDFMRGLQGPVPSRAEDEKP